MHTEEQAKQLWCPFARCLEGSPPGGAGVNRSGPLRSFNCIATECSAWRWAESRGRETLKFRKGAAKYDAIAGTLRVVDGEPWRYEYSDIDSDGEFDLLHRELADNEKNPPKGYCGLAGQSS